jgi:hypothetical protein
MNALYRRFFLILSSLLCVAFGHVDTLASGKGSWIECSVADRFAPFNELPISSIPGYRERAIPYFQARGVTDESSYEDYIRQDLAHIAHALNILFEQDHEQILRHWLGRHFSLLDGYHLEIDHVGRELLGPLSFYLPLLDKLASPLRLLHVRDMVFPSTQVVKVLREHDPDLQGVTIGRVYFQDLIHDKNGCLELFQPSPVDEQCPQTVEATLTRQALLVDLKNSARLTPIDHLAIKLDSVENVQSIHRRIFELASDTLQPNQREVSYNPGDRSTQTKVLLRDSVDTPFNKIIEFVYYGQP